MVRQRIHLHDTEDLAEMARNQGFEIHCDQIEPGLINGTIDFVGTANAQCFRDHFDRAICNHGSIPRGMVALTFPTSCSESAVFRGEPVTPQTFCAITPGDVYSYQAAAGHGILGCCFNAVRLDSALRLRHQMPLSETLSETRSVEIPPAAMAELRLIMQSVFVPSPCSGLVANQHAAESATEERLVKAICNALTARIPRARERLAPRNHWRCVRAARDLIEAHLGSRLRMDTLCQFSRVSERTLDAAFLEVTGLSPQNFIKIRRLNAARHALLRSCPQQTSVKEIALGCGFWHMGHFATDYLSFFGMHPSADLLRSHTAVPGMLME